MTPTIGTNELGEFERRLLTELTVVDELRPSTTRLAPGRVVESAGHLPFGWFRRRRWTLPALAAVAGLLTLGATALAGIYNPASFEPAGGVVAAGGSAQLKGSGCASDSKVTFTLDGKTSLGAGTADREGLFSVGLPVPAGISPGHHDLAAACTDYDGKEFIQRARLQVVKSLPPLGPSFSPEGGAVAGTSTMVKGSGCAAGTKVTFLLDGGTSVGATAADSAGVFLAQLPLPAGTTPGSHELTAACTNRDGTDLVQRAKLEVVEPQEPAIPLLRSERDSAPPVQTPGAGTGDPAPKK